MKNLAIAISILASGPVLAQAACEPKYDVQREADQEDRSQNPVGFENQTMKVLAADKLGSSPANPGAYCPDWRRNDAAAVWRISPADVHYDGPTDEDSRIIDTAHPDPNHLTFRNIYCHYSTTRYPVFPKISGPNSPIVGASDSNKCFTATDVQVDSAAIDGCVHAQVKTADDAWKKAQCLLDINKAVADGRLILSKKVQDDVANVLYAMSQHAPTPHLRAHLQSEIGQ